MRRSLLGFILLAACLAPTAHAAFDDPPPARAAAVQPPVWVERAGAKRALGIGAPLYAGDRYETGIGGRLHIALIDGSAIKLGSNAEFQLPEFKQVGSGGASVFRGALRVLKGAFRFTTGTLSRLHKRELDVYIGPTITAGIRGTDIWGKSDDTREVLCLIEGRVEVGSAGQPTQVMDQPKSFYVVPRGQAPLPIQPTPPGQLELWALQTEMREDFPAMTDGGQFRVALASYDDEADAKLEAEHLSSIGYAADVIVAQVGSAARYRLVTGAFATASEAGRFARASKKLGYKTPWVLRGV